jgi:hypothetical protein
VPNRSKFDQNPQHSAFTWHMSQKRESGLEMEPAWELVMYMLEYL